MNEEKAFVRSCFTNAGRNGDNSAAADDDEYRLLCNPSGEPMGALRWPRCFLGAAPMPLRLESRADGNNPAGAVADACNTRTGACAGKDVTLPLVTMKLERP